jgi:hypothetical protein
MLHASRDIGKRNCKDLGDHQGSPPPPPPPPPKRRPKISEKATIGVVVRDMLMSRA